MIANYGGMPIIVDDVVMSQTVEDWSRVRSPSRAARRRRRGFPQNIDFRVVPKDEIYQFAGKLIMHSEMLKRLEAKIAKQA